jgi:hypothetical protein
VAETEEDGWLKSTWCDSASCVEVRPGEPVLVRDSKLDSSPILRFDTGVWADFIGRVKAGLLDRQ